jgi:hypothetical protein
MNQKKLHVYVVLQHHTNSCDTYQINAESDRLLNEFAEDKSPVLLKSFFYIKEALKIGAQLSLTYERIIGVYLDREHAQAHATKYRALYPHIYYSVTEHTVRDKNSALLQIAKDVVELKDTIGNLTNAICRSVT